MSINSKLRQLTHQALRIIVNLYIGTRNRSALSWYNLPVLILQGPLLPLLTLFIFWEL